MTPVTIAFPAQRTAGLVWRGRVDRIAADMHRLSPRLAADLMVREIGAVTRHLLDLGCSGLEIDEQIKRFSEAVDQRLDGLRRGGFARGSDTATNPSISGADKPKMLAAGTTPVMGKSHNPDDEGPRAA